MRQLISDEFKNLFRTADFMICPITPALAYKRGLSETDPVRMYLGDVFTTIANLAGLPSISLNLGFTPECSCLRLASATRSCSPAPP